MVGYDDVEALDIFGPMETFGHAQLPDGTPAYELRIASLGGRPFVTETGITLQAHAALDEHLAGDTLVIPGGRGARQPQAQAAIAAWLAANEGKFRRIASVCTGAYALAASGLMDGRQVTTHWRHAADLAKRFPALKVQADPIFLKSGKFYTSAGILTGIDLALGLIEEDLGERPAMDVAREIVVYVKRAGGQSQVSEPLKRQHSALGRFAELAGWMHANVGEELSVETLADRVALSSRQFRRRFAEVFETTPREYVENLRIEEAQRLLIETPVSVDRIAGWVGFNSADAFRRVFERRFGMAPTAYRARFKRDGRAGDEDAPTDPPAET